MRFLVDAQLPPSLALFLVDSVRKPRHAVTWACGTQTMK